MLGVWDHSWKTLRTSTKIYFDLKFKCKLKTNKKQTNKQNNTWKHLSVLISGWKWDCFWFSQKQLEIRCLNSACLWLQILCPQITSWVNVLTVCMHSHPISEVAQNWKLQWCWQSSVFHSHLNRYFSAQVCEEANPAESIPIDLTHVGNVNCPWKRRKSRNYVSCLK